MSVEQELLDRKYMKAAVKQAQKAESIGEVPIGCVIVREGKVIARGYNRRMTDKSTLAHAEITAIRKACRKAGDWRLEDCTLYVTLEPCPMCAGAIINARIPVVIYGTEDPKAGSVASKVRMFDLGFNHRPEVISGVLKEECAALLQAFFRDLRARKRLENAPETAGKKEPAD